MQHWTWSAAGAGRPVVVEVVAVAGCAALLVGRENSLRQSSGPRTSFTDSALSLGGAASRCAALLAASCELLRRAARGWWPRVAREGWVTPRRWNAFDAIPWGAWPRDAAVDTHR